MKKTRLGAFLHAALTTLTLGGSTARAQDVPRVFIQGSEVNLRGAPSTSAEVVKKVIIGTECQPLGEAAKPWVRLKCGDAEGFTLKTLVGPAKPDFEALLAQAQAPQTDVKLRLDAAARAATLNPQSDPALELLADLFFEVNFKQLAKDIKKGGLRETFVATCNRAWSSPEHAKKHEDCLATELEKIEYEWHQLRFQGRDFVSAMFREGSLFVYAGRITKRPGKGRFSEGDDDFNIIIESRSQSTIADALKASLQKAATPSTPAHAQDSSQPKYNNWLMESPDMPALPDETSMLIYRSLPPVWHLTLEEQGTRYIGKTCGVVDALLLQLDVHRRASIFEGEANGSFGRPPEGMRVLNASKDGSVYTLDVNTQEGKRRITVIWPTEESNISKWSMNNRWAPDYYTVAHAKNISIRNSCNDDN